jgi:tetratricopeptide (TPR) repeat protein
MTTKSKLWARFRGDFVSAGDLYYRDGNSLKAAEMYGRAGNFLEAARLCAESGEREMAVEYYLEAGAHVQAGEMLAADGRHKEALEHFEKGKAWWQAAEAAVKLNQHERAAKYFEESNHFERSAESFERAGDLEEALRLWDRESARLGRDTDPSGNATQKRRAVDQHRALVMAQLGRVNDAVKVLQQIGMVEQAATLLEKAGRFNEAAAAYLQANQPARAREVLDRTDGLDRRTQADIYSRAGEYARAAELYVELDELGDAAEAYEAAGEWGQAGRVWESAQEPARAAELFYRAGELEAAARCYSKAKDFRLAADTYAKVGDQRKAAECFLQVGEPLRAAQHYLKAGDRSAASAALQKIDPGMPSFEQATLLLVPLLIEDRLYEGALHRLQLLSSEATTSTFAVERQYWEGRIYDAQGDLLRAQSAYSRAAALRRDHRDLAARLISLRQRMARAGIEPGSRSPDSDSGRVELDTGQVLQGRYEILEEIGRGGMGKVYKAKDRQLGGMIAIKTLIPKHSDKLNSEERLRREVQICRRISHPNVVRVFDIGNFGGGLFVTMELLKGTTLDKVIQSGKTVNPSQAKRLFRDVLKGLKEAHGLKVVHRDLKPANIALTKSGAKIMDFGIAHLEDTDVSLTQTGQVIGSPMYMSPEQIQGLPLDARTDLYSFGVLAFTTLTGYEPFTGKTATAISLKHLQDAPPGILDKRPDLDPSWERFVLRLLAKKPADRYPSADAVLAAVDELPN